jgi:hypothetical protein
LSIAARYRTCASYHRELRSRHRARHRVVRCHGEWLPGRAAGYDDLHPSRPHRRARGPEQSARSLPRARVCRFRRSPGIKRSWARRVSAKSRPTCRFRHPPSMKPCSISKPQSRWGLKSRHRVTTTQDAVDISRCLPSDKTHVEHNESALTLPSVAGIRAARKLSRGKLSSPPIEHQGRN